MHLMRIFYQCNFFEALRKCFENAFCAMEKVVYSFLLVVKLAV